MSYPLPTGSFTVRPEAVEALATELRALAADLADDAGWVRAAAASFPVALGGGEGWTAGGTATAWACLHDVLAACADAMAGILVAAVDAYRAGDAALAAPGGPPR